MSGGGAYSRRRFFMDYFFKIIEEIVATISLLAAIFALIFHAGKICFSRRKKTVRSTVAKVLLTVAVFSGAADCGMYLCSNAYGGAGWVSASNFCDGSSTTWAQGSGGGSNWTTYLVAQFSSTVPVSAVPICYQALTSAPSGVPIIQIYGDDGFGGYLLATSTVGITTSGCEIVPLRAGIYTQLRYRWLNVLGGSGFYVYDGRAYDTSFVTDTSSATASLTTAVEDLSNQLGPNGVAFFAGLAIVVVILFVGGIRVGLALFAVGIFAMPASAQYVGFWARPGVSLTVNATGYAELQEKLDALSEAYATARYQVYGEEAPAQRQVYFPIVVDGVRDGIIATLKPTTHGVPSGGGLWSSTSHSTDTWDTCGGYKDIYITGSTGDGWTETREYKYQRFCNDVYNQYYSWSPPPAVTWVGRKIEYYWCVCSGGKQLAEVREFIAGESDLDSAASSSVGLQQNNISQAAYANTVEVVATLSSAAANTAAMNETKPTSAISDYQSPSGITTALRWYTDGATVAAAGVDVGSAPASSYTYTAYYVPPTEVAVTTLPTVTSSVTVNIATITVVASSEVAITRIDLSSSVVQEDTYTWSQVLTDAAGFPGDDIADYWISVASAAIASWPVYAELYNMAQDYSSTVCPSSFTCNMGRWGTVTMPYDESGMTTALQLLKWAWYTWSLYVCFFLIMRGL